jgi:hypothetical protein
LYESASIVWQLYKGVIEWTCSRDGGDNKNAENFVTVLGNLKNSERDDRIDVYNRFWYL